MRFFNTAGPCDPRYHYTVPPEQRLPEARTLIDRGQYFVIHAPRQTGKTTLLRSLARSLTAEGRYAVVHFTCETDEPAGDDYLVASAGSSCRICAPRRRAGCVACPRRATSMPSDTRLAIAPPVRTSAERTTGIGN